MYRGCAPRLLGSRVEEAPPWPPLLPKPSFLFPRPSSSHGSPCPRAHLWPQVCALFFSWFLKSTRGPASASGWRSWGAGSCAWSGRVRTGPRGGEVPPALLGAAQARSASQNQRGSRSWESVGWGWGKIMSLRLPGPWSPTRDSHVSRENFAARTPVPGPCKTFPSRALRKEARVPGLCRPCLEPLGWGGAN